MAARALLIATTVLYRERLAESPYAEHPFPSNVETVMSADELAEFAARSRNLSWDRPNPDTVTNSAYLKALISGEHFRELEHASATFYVTGVSLGLVQSLASEKALTCSPLAQRYVDRREADYVAPTAILDDEELTNALADFYEDACDLYEDFLDALVGRGYSTRDAQDAALSVLPMSTESTLVVTGTMRAWRDVISARVALSADAESRELAWTLLRQLRDVAPNTFQDIPTSGKLTASEIRQLFAVPDSVCDDDCADCESELSTALQLSATSRVA